jgi:hypothetical protein
MATTRQKYPTIRIKAETHKLVKQLAEEDGIRMSDVVAEAIKQYERKRFWDRANRIWNDMMRDPKERAYWAREDAELEGTLMDGLEDDEQWDFPPD